MISSRNVDRIPDGNESASLSDVRLVLKETIEAATLFGRQLFDVWINEAAGADSGDRDTWDTCLKNVVDADIVLVIDNGHAGWALDEGAVGICHAEIEAALHHAPDKVRLIRLEFPSNKKLDLHDPAEVARSGPRNTRFRAFLDQQSRFRARATNRQELDAEALKAIVLAVADIANRARDTLHGRYEFGAALDWTRLGYQERKSSLETVVRDALGRRSGTTAFKGGNILSLGRSKVFVLVHGVPSGFGTPEARELVGRPFLRDHTSAILETSGDVGGPLHIIACHRNVTERQIASFFGHPDLYLVRGVFGYFASDPSSLGQAVFLNGCRDDSTTRLRLQRFFDWLDQAQEAERLTGRSAARRSVVATLAAETAKIARRG